MVAVKIECPCGQHYAFDVEPVNGRMATAVACPSCGADGTDAANAILAAKSPPPYNRPTVRVTDPKPAPAPPPPIVMVEAEAEAPATAPLPAGVRLNARALGLVDHATAETEARAKISWGDSKDDVIRYLMLQGFSAPEAQELVAVLFKERLAALRVKGIRKIITGCGAMCTPVFAWAFFRHIHFISFRLMGIAVMVALWGVWELLNGILLLVAPKMESGDVAD